MKKEGIKTLYIREELHRRAKIEAAQKGITLRSLVEAAISYFLNRGQGNEARIGNPGDAQGEGRW